jgi:NO-binding membrane sensor protein with MHYT domain
MTSMFREAPEPGKDGNPVKGPFSMRRVLAFVLAVASLPLFVVAILFSSQNGWAVYIPGGACLATAIILMFFTSMNDWQVAIAAWRSAQK